MPVKAPHFNLQSIQTDFQETTNGYSGQAWNISPTHKSAGGGDKVSLNRQ